MRMPVSADEFRALVQERMKDHDDYLPAMRVQLRWGVVGAAPTPVGAIGDDAERQVIAWAWGEISRDYRIDRHRATPRADA